MRPDRAKGGAVVRALVSHRCGPGSNKSRCRRNIWEEVVVGSFHCSARSCFFLRGGWGVGKGGGGSRVLRFSPLLKNRHLQIPSNSIWNALVIKTC